MVTIFDIDDATNLLDHTPFDSKLCNYYKDDNNIVIESIDEYLTRVIYQIRVPGTPVTILYPKDGTGFGTFSKALFRTNLVNFDIRYYTFQDGIANEDFKEILTGVSIIEQPVGDIDGDNTLFSTTHPYKSGSIMVFINGLKEHYFIEVNDTQIKLSDAPKNIGFTDIIEVVYTKH